MRSNPFLDILAALLPAAERDELIRRYDAEPFLWSAITNRIAAYVVNQMDPQQLAERAGGGSE